MTLQLNSQGANKSFQSARIENQKSLFPMGCNIDFK